MVAAVPAGPLSGVKLLIDGICAGVFTTKVPWLVAEPAGVTTVMRALTAPAGTTATTCVGELNRKTPGVLPKRIDVTGCRLTPEIVTCEPAAPLSGEKDTTM